jgi:hypothetical protein
VCPRRQRILEDRKRKANWRLHRMIPPVVSSVIASASLWCCGYEKIFFPDLALSLIFGFWSGRLSKSILDSQHCLFLSSSTSFHTRRLKT